MVVFNLKIKKKSIWLPVITNFALLHATQLLLSHTDCLFIFTQPLHVYFVCNLLSENLSTIKTNCLDYLKRYNTILIDVFSLYKHYAMHLFTANFLLDLLGVIVAIGVIVYTYFKWSYQYWERKGVPHIKPKIPFGNADNILTRKRNFGTIVKDLYDELKAKNAKFGGFYLLTRPSFVPVDPEVVKSVLVKDFG